MASVRGILNIQSLNELTYEKESECVCSDFLHSSGDSAVTLSQRDLT